MSVRCFFFFQAEDGIRDLTVTGVQTCALPISTGERALVDSLQRLDPAASPVVLASAALLCMVLDKGDVCLPLARLAGQRPWTDHGFSLPPLAEWQAQLEASPLVGGDGDFTPLTPEHGRLHLARHQAHQRQF